jgi:hypothetical protein
MSLFQHQKHRSDLADIGIGSVNSMARAGLAFVCAILTYTVMVFDESKYHMPSKELAKLQIPSELNAESRRKLSLNLGNGKCLWQVGYMC